MNPVNSHDLMTLGRSGWVVVWFVIRTCIFFFGSWASFGCFIGRSALLESCLTYLHCAWSLTVTQNQLSLFIGEARGNEGVL